MKLCSVFVDVIRAGTSSMMSSVTSCLLFFYFVLYFQPCYSDFIEFLQIKCYFVILFYFLATLVNIAFPFVRNCGSDRMSPTDVRFLFEQASHV